MYIPCRQYDTQYKALTRLYEAATNEQINSGHHTADLPREIKNRTSAVPSIVVLDDVEFLLLKDGDDLLYKLSRTNPQQVTLALTTARPDQLNTDLEERTQSSLQTRTMQFEQYSGQQLYDILAHRARESLQPRSLRQDALTYIASTTSHSSFALTWLKTAAKHTDDHITETTVKQTQESAYNTFIETQLQDFTPHHRLLYQAITELEKEVDSPVHTGQVNQRYRDLSQVQNENQVSNRQLSTYLKQLDLLDLIQTKYHYGGQKGKTREIILNTPGHL